MKDTEQDGVSWRRPALSFPPCHVAYRPNHGAGCIYGDKGNRVWRFYAKFWEACVPGVALGGLIKYCPELVSMICQAMFWGAWGLPEA